MRDLNYDGIVFDAGYRIDQLAEDVIVIELKTVEQHLPVHHAQMRTYLKLSGRSLGLLINFNVALIKNGIRRIALNLRNHNHSLPWRLRVLAFQTSSL